MGRSPPGNLATSSAKPLREGLLKRPSRGHRQRHANSVAREQDVLRHLRALKDFEGWAIGLPSLSTAQRQVSSGKLAKPHSATQGPSASQACSPLLYFLWAGFKPFDCLAGWIQDPWLAGNANTALVPSVLTGHLIVPRDDGKVGPRFLGKPKHSRHVAVQPTVCKCSHVPNIKDKSPRRRCPGR